MVGVGGEREDEAKSDGWVDRKYHVTRRE
jgi:hypothetical protein